MSPLRYSPGKSDRVQAKTRLGWIVGFASTAFEAKSEFRLRLSYGRIPGLIRGEVALRICALRLPTRIWRQNRLAVSPPWRSFSLDGHDDQPSFKRRVMQ